MPQPALTVQERRLAAFCRVFAVVYFAGAFCLVALPVALPRIEPSVATPEALFWDVLASALMVAAGTACLVTAARPRERRHAILPVAAAQLTVCALAAAHLLFAGRSAAFASMLAVGLPLLAATVAIYRAAAPGVHSEPAREGPPAAEPPPSVQLKVSKS